MSESAKIVRTKTANDIRAQLERIYARTGGQYSANPRRIQADIVANRYLKNIDNQPENRADISKIGQLAMRQVELRKTKNVRNRNAKIQALEEEIRALSDNINNRGYSRRIYAKNNR